MGGSIACVSFHLHGSILSGLFSWLLSLWCWKYSISVPGGKRPGIMKDFERDAVKNAKRLK